MAKKFRLEGRLWARGGAPWSANLGRGAGTRLAGRGQRCLRAQEGRRWPWGPAPAVPLLRGLAAS